MHLRFLLSEGRALLESEANRFVDDMEKAGWALSPSDHSSHRNHLEAANEAVKALDALIRLGSFSDHFYPEERKTIELARRHIKASSVPMAALSVKEKKPLILKMK